MQKPSIYLFTNYRLYLKELLEYTRTKNPEFSYRKFCKKADIVSPSFLKHVIDGQRNLSLDGARKFMVGLSIEGQDSLFFELLVQMNQAKTNEIRNKFYQKLKKFPNFQEIHKLEKDGFEYYRQWYHPVVREMVNMYADKINPQWVAVRLNPRITVKQAQDSLDLLTRLGLIKKAEKGYTCEHKVVKGFTDLRSMMLQNYHGEMIQLGKESMERFSSDVRNVTSVTLSIAKEKIPEIQKKLAELREELLQLAVSSQNPDTVIQVNLQEFPLTQVPVYKDRSK